LIIIYKKDNMSILKEPKSLDDRSIKEDSIFEKWEDKYPTDKYRTFATHVPMFDFTTKTSPTLEWHVDSFSKWFKNPEGLSVAPNEKVPLTHYKLGSNEPAKEDKDVFGNNIINNQKDIKADYMNRALTEKYTYGLDRKGQGDFAYQQLDIEYGDDNELARAREEFNNMLLARELEPGPFEANERLSLELAKTEPQQISKKKVIQRQMENANIDSKIAVEQIPVFIKDREKQYALADEEEQIDAIKYFMQKYRKESRSSNGSNKFGLKPLPKGDILDMNAIFKAFGESPIPYGTFKSVALERLKKIYNQIPTVRDMREEAVKNTLKSKIKRKKAFRRGLHNELRSRAPLIDTEPSPAPASGPKRPNNLKPANAASLPFGSPDFGVKHVNLFGQDSESENRGAGGGGAGGGGAGGKREFRPEDWIQPTPHMNPKAAAQKKYSKTPVFNVGKPMTQNHLSIPLMHSKHPPEETKQNAPQTKLKDYPAAKPPTKPSQNNHHEPPDYNDPPPLPPPDHEEKEEISAGGGGASSSEYMVGDTAEIRNYNKALDMIATTYEMSLSKAIKDGSEYTVSQQFKEDIGKLLNNHKFNASTRTIKQIAAYMRTNKPQRVTERESRSRSKASESRPPSSSGVTETWEL
jgi:hypothetical protein